MRRSTRLKRKITTKKLGAGLAAVLVALGGSLLLMHSHAATYVAAQDAETGSRSGPAAICKDNEASASLAVKFGQWDCGTASRMFTNPVNPETADPGVFEYQGKYYMVCTYTGTQWFAIYMSDDLVNWKLSGKSVFYGTKHVWGKDSFWAPELHQLKNGRFAVYYSARDFNNGMHIGVATADNILGPYTDLGRPLVTESFDTIDANFILTGGRQYLIYKENTGDTRIFARELNADGISFVNSNRTTLLQRSLGWEGPGIEGPWIQEHNGQFYMFFSGNYFASDAYAVGVAKSNSVLGPYTKKSSPILTSGSRWKGPGHNSITHVGPTDYMMYHAWDKTPGYGMRTGLIDKITWGTDWPSVGTNGHPTETAQPYPY